jgi:hypothetical protein
MKVGDKVKLNQGVTRLPTQVRLRYRPGDAGEIARLISQTHVMVKVKDKGTIKVAKSWVDLA